MLSNPSVDGGCTSNVQALRNAATRDGLAQGITPEWEGVLADPVTAVGALDHYSRKT
jgi:hypothetical protein